MILSFDFGTTKIAAVLYDPKNPGSSVIHSAVHHAATDAGPGKAEQDVFKLKETFLKLIRQFSKTELERVSKIVFTGQMHSIIFWNENTVSNVVTWQDHRASTEGTLELFRQKSNCCLADGFGGTTLAQMTLENTLSQWLFCADPADYFAALITQRSRPVMDPTFAASWGIFDLQKNKWNEKAVDALNIPHHLLPEIVPSGTVVGETAGVCGLPPCIPVVCALGDNQASVIGSLENTGEELFLTLGTGGQLSAAVTQNELQQIQLSPEIEIRPFTGGKFLVVYAPLCGGSAWAWLGKSINVFLNELGLEKLDEKQLLDRLDQIASGTSPLQIKPDFLGRRNAPEATASISGITLDNFTLANLAGALGYGIIEDMFSHFPTEIVRSRKRISVSGNCIRLCGSIRYAAEKISGLPVQICNVREEAASGAAKAVLHLLNTSRESESRIQTL